MTENDEFLAKLGQMISDGFYKLLKQGGYGYDGRFCNYLDDEGYSCVVGLMVRDHMPKVTLERAVGAVFTHLLDNSAVGKCLTELLQPQNSWQRNLMADRLSDAQAVHDHGARIGMPMLEYLEKQAKSGSGVAADIAKAIERFTKKQVR